MPAVARTVQPRARRRGSTSRRAIRARRSPVAHRRRRSPAGSTSSGDQHARVSGTDVFSTDGFGQSVLASASDGSIRLLCAEVRSCRRPPRSLVRLLLSRDQSQRRTGAALRASRRIIAHFSAILERRLQPIQCALVAYCAHARPLATGRGSDGNRDASRALTQWVTTTHAVRARSDGQPVGSGPRLSRRTVHRAGRSTGASGGRVPLRRAQRASGRPGRDARRTGHGRACRTASAIAASGAARSRRRSCTSRLRGSSHVNATTHSTSRPRPTDTVGPTSTTRPRRQAGSPDARKRR